MGEHSDTGPICERCETPWPRDAKTCPNCGGTYWTRHETHMFGPGEFESRVDELRQLQEAQNAKPIEQQRAEAVEAARGLLGVEPYFVYVAGGRHVWRFVSYVERAASGDDAIDQAQAEARELGNDVSETGYMAVPASAITTRTGVRA